MAEWHHVGGGVANIGVHSCVCMSSPVASPRLYCSFGSLQYTAAFASSDIRQYLCTAFDIEGRDVSHLRLTSQDSVRFSWTWVLWPVWSVIPRKAFRNHLDVPTDFPTHLCLGAWCLAPSWLAAISLMHADLPKFAEMVTNESRACITLLALHYRPCLSWESPKLCFYFLQISNYFSFCHRMSQWWEPAPKPLFEQTTCNQARVVLLDHDEPLGSKLRFFLEAIIAIFIVEISFVAAVTTLLIVAELLHISHIINKCSVHFWKSTVHSLQLALGGQLLQVVSDGMSSRCFKEVSLAWIKDKLTCQILQICPFSIKEGQAISHQLALQHLESVPGFILASLPVGVNGPFLLLTGFFCHMAIIADNCPFTIDALAD